MKVPRLEPIAPRHGDTDHRGSARSGTVSAGETDALVSDTVYLTPMTGRPTSAHVPHEAYNLDQEQARESVRRLAALRPRIVGVGHLGPMTGPGVVAELEAAAR